MTRRHRQRRATIDALADILARADTGPPVIPARLATDEDRLALDVAFARERILDGLRLRRDRLKFREVCEGSDPE